MSKIKTFLAIYGAIAIQAMILEAIGAGWRWFMTAYMITIIAWLGRQVWKGLDEDETA